MQQYECGVCGYVYDPSKGDEVGNIPPNTAFENLPEEWACPICGAGKNQFVPVS
jgi:rubredoxin